MNGHSGIQQGAIGILGGTFDPVHYGHLRSAVEVRERLGLSTVHMLPSARPPHRGQHGAGAEQGGGSCNGCADGMGPGFGGCYWDPLLESSCGDLHWSASANISAPINKWTVDFEDGAVASSREDGVNFVFCVREGP